MAVIIIASVYATARKTHTDNKRVNGITVKTIIAIAGWLIYIVVLTNSGALANTGLPPRIPILVVFPVFIFIGWLFTSKRNSELIAAVPDGLPVYLQSFRIVVELLLLEAYRQHVLPRSATFEGYNFEVVTGITAVVVGYIGYTRALLPKWVLLTWNITGLATLAIVVFIIISHAYLPGLWHDNEQFSMKDFATLPYMLLAGFLMPLAVFMHIMSIIKTIKKQR